MKPEILKQKLTCAEEIASTINAHQEQANAYRNEINSHRKKNNPEIPLSITKAFVFTAEKSTEHFYRKINNLKFYYNFYNEKERLFSSVLSGKPISLELEFHDSCKHLKSKVNLRSWKI